MDQEALIAFCRTLPAATEDIKWDNDLVFSVGGKMFAAFALDCGPRLSCKCSETDFLFLTGIAGIDPAPYLARAHWVSISPAAGCSEVFLRERLATAHALVLAKLPKKVRLQLLPQSQG